MSGYVSLFMIGLALGTALILGGLTQPRVIIGVLDVGGDWDPTLLMFFGAAVSVARFAHRWILRRPKPVYAESFGLPTKTRLEPRLFIGAAMFGVGWGLAGICPGPAITTLGAGAVHGLVFVPSMLAGMVLFRLWEASNR